MKTPLNVAVHQIIGEYVAPGQYWAKFKQLGPEGRMSDRVRDALLCLLLERIEQLEQHDETKAAIQPASA